jgi:glucose-6-phosphate 1-dehydrogenase
VLCLSENACIMTVFGGTGDLTHRKLMPALYNLKCRGELPENFAFVGVARKEKRDEQYRNELKDSVRKYSELTWQEDEWQELASAIFYLNFQLDDDAGYVAQSIEIKSSTGRRCGFTV